MPTFHFHRIVVAVLLILPAITGSSLIGQVFPQDMRLSPEEPPHYDVIRDYQIQSTEQSGDRRLVVWGTTRGGDAGTAGGELRCQLLEGTALLGPQRVVTDTAARPFGFVQVVASELFFLIVWNDKRENGAGIYAQRMSLAGELLGGEVRISPGHILVWDLAMPGVVVLNAVNGRKLLLWRDNRRDWSGMYTLRFDRNGRLEFPVVRVASWIDAILQFRVLPGLTFLQASDSMALMVHPDGSMNGRTTRQLRSDVAYNLGPDTSLVTLAGKRLRYYASVFADTAAWGIELPCLDSAVAKTGMVARDSTGQIRVYFTTLHITGSDQTSGFITISEYCVDIVAPKLPLPPPILVHQRQFLNGYNGSTTILSASLKGSAYQQGNDNTGFSSITLSHSRFTWGNPPGVGTGNYAYSVDNFGRLHYDSTGFIPLDWTTPVIVRRVAEDTLSIVHVDLPDTTLELSAPVAPRAVRNPVIRPLITSATDSLVHCFWIDSLHGPTLGQTTLPFASPAVIVDRLQSEPLPSFSYENYGGTGTITSVFCNYLYHTDDLFVSSGFFGYKSIHLTLCKVEEYFTSSSATHYTDYRYRTRIYLPGLNGWNPAIGFSGTGREYYSEPLGVHAEVGGYDPDRKELMVIVGKRKPEETTVEWSATVCGRDGSIQWELGDLNFRGNENFLPVDSLLYLRITPDSVRLCRQLSVLSVYSLPRAGMHANYQRIHGPYFLRTSWQDSSSTRLILEIFHTTDGLVATQLLPIPARAGLASIVQRPSDSTIVVLWGTEKDGVHAAVLGRTLQVLVGDMSISRGQGKALNPSGLFRDSTLYVVWEDYRNGVAEIYCNAVVVPAMPDTTAEVAEIENEAEVLALSVSPNPAQGSLRVYIQGTVAAGGEIEILDLLGTRLSAQTVRPGVREVLLDAQSLVPGLYFMRLKGGGKVTAAVKVLIE